MIVWLASYPRSGNTFFRVILNSVFGIKTYSIYDDKGDIGADEKTSEIVGHEFLPEDFDLEKAREAEKTYYIKTHGKPLNDEDKVIYLIRDGRESILSNIRHQNSFYEKNYTLVDAILGYIDMGSWGNHVSEWDPKRRKNTLLVSFEDLIDNPLEYIKTISTFLDLKPISGSIPTFNELQKINPVFFRSGKKSSWKEVYTRDEHLLFWLKNAAQMKEYGYMSDIPEQFTNNLNSDLFRLLSLENEYRIQKLNRRINVLNRENQKKDKRLNDKDMKLEERRLEISRLKNLNNDFAKENQRKDKHLNDKDMELEERRLEISRLKNLNNDFAKENQRKDKHLNDKDMELEERRLEISRLKNLNNDFAKENQRKDKHLNDKDMELEERRLEISRLKNLNNDFAKETQRKDKHLNDKDMELEERRLEISRLKNLNNDFAKETQRKDKELLIMHNEFKKLKNSIESICQVSAITSPLKKINTYKQMMKLYHEIKGIQ